MKQEFNAVRTSLAVAAALLVSQGAFASGYNFGTQSAAAQGTANANGAEANDASTIYSNPAGMSRLKGTNFTQVLDLVLPSVEFSQKGSATGAAYSPTTSAFVTSLPISGNNGGDPVHSTWVPHGYLTHQFNDQWSAGVGVFVPFGAKVEYNDQFIGRYYGQKTEMKTIDVNPSVSFKLNEQHSFGFGLDFQYMKAKLQRKVATSASSATDLTFHVEGDSWGYGYNLGYLFQLDERTRFGIAYRSAIKQDNKGDATLYNPNGSVRATSSDASANVKTPESLSINGYHDLNDKWAVMGDVTFTRHSHLDQIVIDALPITVTYMQTNWRNTFKASAGASYKLTDTIKLRAGYAYDKSPSSSDADVLPTMPDNDRQWLSFGGNWKLSSKDSLDFAYSYIFIRDREMSRSYDSATTADRPGGIATTGGPAAPGTSYGSVSGTFKSSAQILGVQWNHAF
jgi:long-chain fatty acid transport protein